MRTEGRMGKTIFLPFTPKTLDSPQDTRKIFEIAWSTRLRHRCQNLQGCSSIAHRALHPKIKNHRRGPLCISLLAVMHLQQCHLPRRLIPPGQTSITPGSAFFFFFFSQSQLRFQFLSSLVRKRYYCTIILGDILKDNDHQ